MNFSAFLKVLMALNEINICGYPKNLNVSNILNVPSFAAVNNSSVYKII